MLSFVVPAFNECDFIETSLDILDSTIKSMNLPYEIMVVNDGSKDETLNKIKSYSSRNDHVKYISFERNKGKGYAVQAGFMKSSGDTVIFVDGDMDIDFRLIREYIDALKNADIVIASKRHPDSVVTAPFKRRILSYGFNILVRLLVGVKLRDTQVGLKAMKRDAFEHIFPKLAVKRYAFDVELLAVANFYGLKVVEMPAKLSIQSSFKPRDAFRMFTDLLGIAYRLRIIHWYQRPVANKNRLQGFVSKFYPQESP